jgi:hypothetical protein
LECGRKLSAKEYQERLREDEAREAERRAAETPGLIDLRNASPRSREVFDTVLDITRRELLQNQERTQVLRGIATRLHEHVYSLAPQPPVAAPPLVTPVSILSPNWQQPFTQGQFQLVGTHYPTGIPVNIGPYPGTGPVVPGSMPTFQGQQSVSGTSTAAQPESQTQQQPPWGQQWWGHGPGDSHEVLLFIT